MAAKKTKIINKTSCKTSWSPDIQDRIQKKAYELFEKRVYQHGSDLSDWFEAEKMVKASRR
jgi:hypothetical protein